MTFPVFSGVAQTLTCAWALPSSDARAHLVAQCLSTTPPCASGTFNPGTCASAGCLDTEVKVRVESLALK